jgi:hypothetical protein
MALQARRLSALGYTFTKPRLTKERDTPMFQVTTTGYLVECPTCSSQQIASSLRDAKNTFDFHECSDIPLIVSDYTLVMAKSPAEYVKPMFGTRM